MVLEGAVGPLSWGETIQWVLGIGDGWAGSSPPWVGTSVERNDVLEGTTGWVAAECGPTPGSKNCKEAELLIGAWWGNRQPDGHKVWKRMIGIPGEENPCGSIWDCPGAATHQNIPAKNSFVFQNPYQDQTVRFEVRYGEKEGCSDDCDTGAIEVQAGDSIVIPASPGGYYYAETQPGISANALGLSGWAFPPPEGLLPTFATGGAP